MVKLDMECLMGKRSLGATACGTLILELPTYLEECGSLILDGPMDWWCDMRLLSGGEALFEALPSITLFFSLRRSALVYIIYLMHYILDSGPTPQPQSICPNHIAWQTHCVCVDVTQCGDAGCYVV